jgi:hypothetical protein
MLTRNLPEPPEFFFFFKKWHRTRFIEHAVMATYADKTLDRIAPMLKLREKEHVLVTQDESVFHTNEYRH